MFKGLGDLMSLMGKAKEVQNRMNELQDKLAQMRVRGLSGGGMVTVEVNGKMDVLACHIEPSLVDSGDREMIEELVISAMNDALFKSRAATAKLMEELTNLPGISETVLRSGLESSV